MLVGDICWKFWKNNEFSKWWRESERYKRCYITLPFLHKGALNMLSDRALHSKGFHTCIFNQDYISHTSIIAHKCSRLFPLENISALCVCCQLFFFFSLYKSTAWWPTGLFLMYLKQNKTTAWDRHWKGLCNSLSTVLFLLRLSLRPCS